MEKFKYFFQLHYFYSILVLLIIAAALESPVLLAQDKLSEEQTQTIAVQALKSIKLEQFSQAQGLSERILMQFPNDLRVLQIYVTSLWGQKKYFDIMKTVISAQKRGVTSPALYERLAEAFFMIRQYEPSLQALANFEKTWLEENPGAGA